MHELGNLIGQFQISKEEYDDYLKKITENENIKVKNVKLIQSKKEPEEVLELDEVYKNEVDEYFIKKYKSLKCISFSQNYLSDISDLDFIESVACNNLEIYFIISFNLFDKEVCDNYKIKCNNIII